MVDDEFAYRPMEIDDRCLLHGIRFGAFECSRGHSGLNLGNIHKILFVDSAPLGVSPVAVELPHQWRYVALAVALQRPDIEDAALGIRAVRAGTIPEDA